ncbi:hypothetical protein BS47DRAFT_1133561 [Hydnum rufescens UP504]|uniref:Uncharacterized protein n=1 Tax=Hydnum rufescens UP504 TaxID=1448309 RepID=A0A9P6DR57_9AGAM|nr:hypothetical protein BS47DRAFT_1133561 [Hydnum rufescens UP504]
MHKIALGYYQWHPMRRQCCGTFHNFRYQNPLTREKLVNYITTQSIRSFQWIHHPSTRRCHLAATAPHEFMSRACAVTSVAAVLKLCSCKPGVTFNDVLRKPRAESN